jgi:hypothetical protein
LVELLDTITRNIPNLNTPANDSKMNNVVYEKLVLMAVPSVDTFQEDKRLKLPLQTIVERKMSYWTVMMTIVTNLIKVTKRGTSGDGALCCVLLFVDTEV